MRNNQLRWLIIILAVILVQACAKDELDVLELSDAEVEDLNTVEQDSLTARRQNNRNNGLNPSEETVQLISDWNDLWLVLDRYTNGLRPNTTARALAYIHLAGYETAVADMDGYGSTRNQLQGFNLDQDDRPANVDRNLALNTCYALVFDHFMFSVSNNAKSGIATLENEMAEELSENLSQEEIEDSEEWGALVAEMVIAYSQTDNAAETQQLDPNPASYVAPVGVGLWAASEGESAWFPYWNQVRTFVISPEQTSSTPPPFDHNENRNSGYYEQMDEVEISATTARLSDNEDLWISEFWSDDVEGLMMSPPGRQFSIANQLIEQEDLDFEETLELLLKLGFAMNDAAVSAWDDKYTYNTERPSRYILEYINDDFQTNLARFISSPNPAFPAYPSGHATFAAVASGVFIDIFGGDAINFTDRTHAGRSEFRSDSRSFNSFSEMAEENGYSRIPLGVHIQADSDEGARLGYEISAAINSFNLSPNF
ncbi:vanadium-dependent haloperoxidase [Maribacter forsetii]|uniref:vanadium-dependent haloperoxidase n=1 Tax=Maribacter forsetii TaxID=444515 RepID=UPI000563E05A|nr:vanadium-dependent haloperoxidase [Maribacter forsetii]